MHEMEHTQSQYFIRSQAAPNAVRASVTIHIHDLLNNIEHLYSNTFRFGNVIVEIDETQSVEVVDDYGRRCRISGPAGPKNLERFKQELAAHLPESGS
jgi:imidazoleglycerol phosphate dehydratase HisB